MKRTSRKTAPQSSGRLASRGEAKSPEERAADRDVSPLSLASTIVGDESVWETMRRFHGALTPQSISMAIAEAEAGRPKTYVDLVFGIRRRDGHIHDCLQVRELGTKTLKIAVVPRKLPNKRKSKRSENIANELKAALDTVQNFADARAALVGDNLLFGRAYQEIVWRITRDSRLWPGHFKHVHPRRFVFRQVDSRLLFDTEGHGNEIDGIDLEEAFPAGKFLSYRGRVNGDALIKEGIGQLVCWLGMFRNWGTRDWLQTAEASWKPRRKGVYQKEASTPDKAALRAATKQLNSNGACIIPSTVDITELWSQARAKGEHQLLLKWLGAEFTKASLGSPDAVEPSDTGSAKVDAQVRAVLREELRESDALDQSICLTNDIAVPFTQFNYGTEEESPLILCLTDDVKDVGAFAGMVETLQRTGLKIGASFVRDKTGFRAPEEGEEVLVSPMWTNEGAGTGGGTNGAGDQPKPKEQE